MYIDEIHQAFDYIHRTGEFLCSQINTNSEVIVYTIEANINIVHEYHVVAIDVNFFLPQNIAVFVMNMSKGYSGEKVNLMDKLLLRINTITFGGYFGYWYKNGDIVFRNDVAIDYLDCQKILQILRFFERVYIGVKPKLESYASEWMLQYTSEKDQSQLTGELAWFFDGIKRSLSE